MNIGGLPKSEIHSCKSTYVCYIFLDAFPNSSKNIKTTRELAANPSLRTHHLLIYLIPPHMFSFTT